MRMQFIKRYLGKRERMKGICICAASKTKNGQTIRGHRYADCIYTAQRMGMKLEDLGYADQGFVNPKHRYVSREEGRKLQDSAGIPSADHPEGYKGKTLFSEDLYYSPFPPSTSVNLGAVSSAWPRFSSCPRHITDGWMR